MIVVEGRVRGTRKQDSKTIEVVESSAVDERVLVQPVIESSRSVKPFIHSLALEPPSFPKPSLTTCLSSTPTPTRLVVRHVSTSFRQRLTVSRLERWHARALQQNRCPPPVLPSALSSMMHPRAHAEVQCTCTTIQRNTHTQSHRSYKQATDTKARAKYNYRQENTTLRMKTSLLFRTCAQMNTVTRTQKYRHTNRQMV